MHPPVQAGCYALCKALHVTCHFTTRRSLGRSITKRPCLSLERFLTSPTTEHRGRSLNSGAGRAIDFSIVLYLQIWGSARGRLLSSPDVVAPIIRSAVTLNLFYYQWRSILVMLPPPGEMIRSAIAVTLTAPQPDKSDPSCFLLCRRRSGQRWHRTIPLPPIL